MSSNDQLDLRELVALAHDKSVVARNRLVDVVSDLFFQKGSSLSDRERSLMTDILRQLIHDVEMSIRCKLSELLAKKNDAPHELVATLANDLIEVAHPILTESPVLRDVELIEIIQHRTLEHQLAIANRRQVSEVVSDALVETGNVDVIKTLLENKNAMISNGTMEYLVDESKRVDRYQNPLLRRPDLSPELAKNMYWWVSAALREFILEKFKLDETEFDATMDKAVHAAIKDGRKTESADSKAGELARSLGQQRQINPELMIRSLRQGEIRLFEAMFAEFAQLPPLVVRRVIYEPGGKALAVACRAVGIDKGDFASIFLLSRSARPGEKVVDPNELNDVVSMFDKVSIENAKKILARWRLDPNYLQAMDSLAKRGIKDE